MASKTKSPKIHPTLELIVLAVAIIEPLITIPQVYNIWSSHSAAGISLVTWAGYVAAAAIWMIYGYKTKDKPLFWSSLLWVISEGLVFVGALVYR